MTHPGGRPLKFPSVEELDRAIDEYFDSCRDENGRWNRPATMTGLALALGTNRQTLLNYSQRDEFIDSLTRAKTLAENFAEEQLFLGRNATGAQFSLTNNHGGWDNKSSVNLGGQKDNPVKVEASVTLAPDEAYRQMLNRE